MVRTVTISGAVLVAWLANGIADAQAQKMPGKGACQRGLSFEDCMSRCVALGGRGKKAPETKCAKRCTKKGCV